MTDFITEIPSDSTVTKIEIKERTATIYFTFDVEMNGKMDTTLIFEELASINVLPGWDKEIYVEGIRIMETSPLLEETKTLLKKDEESQEFISTLRSYHIMNGFSEKPLIEVIAPKYSVK